MRDGLKRFVLDVAAPLAARVGNAWAAGNLQVYHEHLFSEAIQTTLRALMRPLADVLHGRGGRPRVLLTTISGEGHGLGILMAEAMFTLSECECMQLGLQTPLHDIVDAVSAHNIDIVALSFLAVLLPHSIATGLNDLRKLLPPHVHLWVGGSSPALRRKAHDGIEYVSGLAPIEETVADWRQSAAIIKERSQCGCGVTRALHRRVVKGLWHTARPASTTASQPASGNVRSRQTLPQAQVSLLTHGKTRRKQRNICTGICSVLAGRDALPQREMSRFVVAFRLGPLDSRVKLKAWLLARSVMAPRAGRKSYRYNVA